MANEKREKPLLIIPNEFVEKALNIITDESVEGTNKLSSIAQLAKEKYTGPVDSWITGWFYQFTRTRTKMVDHSINTLNQNPNYFTRLEEFKELISHGNWTHSSYNFYLFLELIKTIPGYLPLTEEETFLFVHKLKDEIIVSINRFINDYLGELQSSKKRKSEMDLTIHNSQLHAEYILIFNNKEVARVEARSDEKETVFCLIKQKYWELTLFDNEGNEHPLKLTTELSEYLLTKEIQDIKKLNPVQLNPIKKECIKAKDQFLSRVHLLINPKQTNAELRLQNVCSIFVLRSTAEENRLWWINSLGSANKIDLKTYPQIDNLLSHRLEALNETTISRLKVHLLGVKTTQNFNAEKMNQLNELLVGVLKRVPGDVKAQSRIKLIINPQEDNAKLTHNGINSTFILRQSDKKNTLWWANCFSEIDKIGLSTYQELNTWLQENHQPFNEENLLQIKYLLAKINTTQALNSTKVGVLNNLLTDKFKKDFEKVNSKKPMNLAPESRNLAPKLLTENRYTFLSKLPDLWQKKLEQQKEEQELSVFDRFF